MRVDLDLVLGACEFSGGAVPPPHVIALCIALRKYRAIMTDMASVIHSGQVTLDQIEEFTTRMEDARSSEMPARPWSVV